MKPPKDFKFELRFFEMPGKGFQCYFPLNRDIVGFGMTLEECEEDFINKWEGFNLLGAMETKAQFEGSQFKVTTFDFECPIEKKLYVTTNTKKRYHDNPELKEYFNKFLKKL